MSRSTANIFVSVLFTAAALPSFAQQQPAIVGTWVGELKVQSQSLALVFNVSLSAGELKASIDCPTQAAMGIPVSSIAVSNGLVAVRADSIKAVFTGRLSADSQKIDGTWAQGGADYSLVLEKRAAGETAPVIKRPQEPKPPFPYTTEEVTVANTKDGILLAGTLVIPRGAGPFPAIVFATGSGPQNRDEELLGHKPFLVIADYLARRGIASLRCDDRGIGESTGDFSAGTTFDFADDVEAAFEYLSSRPEAKKGAVGIVGHSEGGLIAPIVASRNAKVAFVVLLAGPGIACEDILKRQAELIARSRGEPEAVISRSLAINARLYEIAKGPGSADDIKNEVKKAYLDWVESNDLLTPQEKTEARSGADNAAGQLTQPWLRTFLTLDPVPYLSKVSQPVLALDGSKDLQVPSAEDLAGIRAALAKVPGAGPNPKNKILELPGLNHLFQHAGTGAPEEYAKIEETFAPEALKAIGDWILGL